jgi:hypothetical protein
MQLGLANGRDVRQPEYDMREPSVDPPQKIAVENMTADLEQIEPFTLVEEEGHVPGDVAQP